MELNGLKNLRDTPFILLNFKFFASTSPNFPGIACVTASALEHTLGNESFSFIGVLM